jgi:DNA-binding PadR family transcriptional regulator
MASRTRPDQAAAGRSNDPAILILTSLADGEKHGYALLQDIEEFAGVRLGPGTLYGAIGRLEERGLIDAVGASGRRRPYRLSASGAAALKVALDDLRAIVDEGTARLASRPASGPSLRGGVA